MANGENPPALSQPRRSSHLQTPANSVVIQGGAASTSIVAVLRRRWWLILLIMVAAVGVTFIGSLNAPPVYRSSMRLQVLVLDEQEVTLFTRLSTAASGEQVFITQSNFSDVLRSPLIAWQTIKDLGLDMSANELLDGLTVSVSADFMTVSYEASSAQLAQDILAQHVQNALEHYKSLRARPAIAAGQFIQAELDSQAQTLKAAQDDLVKFQLEHNVGDLLREINALQDVLRNLETSRSTALAEAARADTLAQQWQQFADEAEAAAEAAREQLRSLVPLTATLGTPTAAATVAEQPALTEQIQALQEEIAYQSDLARSYRATARTHQANAAAQRAVATEQEKVINQRKTDLAQLISLSSEYNALVAAVNSAQADYDFLRSKAVEARLKQRQIRDVGYLQVVEPPFLPAAPAPSPTLRLTLLAALISLLVGLIVALLLEFVSPTRAARPRAARLKSAS